MCSMHRRQSACSNNGLSFSGSRCTSSLVCKQLDYSTVSFGISKLYRAILTWICPLGWSSKSVQSISSSGVGHSNTFNKSHLFSTYVAFSISIGLSEINRSNSYRCYRRNRWTEKGLVQRQCSFCLHRELSFVFMFLKLYFSPLSKQNTYVNPSL